MLCFKGKLYVSSSGTDNVMTDDPLTETSLSLACQQATMPHD